MFDWMNVLPGLILTSAVTLSGISAVGPALDSFTQPYKEAARIQCYAKSQVYMQHERQAAEDICTAKKFAEIEKQIAPAKALVAALSI